ncbi:hypothetical protein SD80_012255 [Scytonema tolypothrichoides VB-61278]|nr:hypothetical protein SD80_012255 [Scytonema tolypothrichoides VB-61278]
MLEDTRASFPQEQILQWQEVEQGHFRMTTTYGQAVIIAIPQQPSPYTIGSSEQYTTYIEYESTARLVMPYRTTDFLEAERWIKARIEELSDPRITEAYLPIIAYTLDICMNYFRQANEVFHQERMAYVKSIIETVLP